MVVTGFFCTVLKTCNASFFMFQYGSGCLCGDKYYETYSTSCRDRKHVKCSGDHTAICGGADDAVDVYKGKCLTKIY